ncbi:protein AIR1/2 [Pseudohyphozyma bogoriensis]|nr:protein AIR1/2 [Pseudohyphozyma bogoriensis]
MGRLQSPKKPSSTSRTLSTFSPPPSRSPSASPAPQLAPDLFAALAPPPPPPPASTTPTVASSSTTSVPPIVISKPASPPPQAQSPAAAMKRPFAEDSVSPGSTSTSANEQQDLAPKKPKRRRKSKAEKAAARAAAAVAAFGGDPNAVPEEGEVDEFAGLFMVDITPSAIKIEQEVAEEDGKEKSWDERQKEDERERIREEEEQMRLFAKEVAETSSEEESGDDDSDEEEEDEGKAEVMYDDENALQKAIQGRINDDSAAKSKDTPLASAPTHNASLAAKSMAITKPDTAPSRSSAPVAALEVTSLAFVFMPLTLLNNCPTLWREYDSTGANPSKKAKITYACGNDGSTGDHFIDDCLLPRMHPVKFVDPSPFNRAALGVGHSGDRDRGTRGAAGSQSSARRRGAGMESRMREEEEEEEDDDCFDRFGSGGTYGRSKYDDRRGGGNDRERYDSPRGGGGGSGSGKGGAPSLLSRMGKQQGDRDRPSPKPRYGGGYF